MELNLDAIIASVAPELKEQALAQVKTIVLAKLNSLNSDEISAKIVEALDNKVDEIDMKGLPDNVIDPIIKKVIGAYVPKLIEQAIEAAKAKLV
jgi:hypothetical protein